MKKVTLSHWIGIFVFFACHTHHFVALVLFLHIHYNVNYTGFLFGSEWSSNSPVWCTRHCAFKCLSTSVVTVLHWPRSVGFGSVLRKKPRFRFGGRFSGSAVVNGCFA